MVRTSRCDCIEAIDTISSSAGAKTRDPDWDVLLVAKEFSISVFSTTHKCIWRHSRYGGLICIVVVNFVVNDMPLYLDTPTRLIRIIGCCCHCVRSFLPSSLMRVGINNKEFLQSFLNAGNIFWEHNNWQLLLTHCILLSKVVLLKLWRLGCWLLKMMWH